MSCWAASLGGCGGGASREHMVSASQFDTETITVQGLPWCRDAPKTIGLASLVAKNLCRDHNKALSPVDKAAMKFKRALYAARTDGLPFPVNLDARLIE